MYAGDPTISARVASKANAVWATPKSATFASPSAPMRMLAGFRSRWITPSALA